MTRDRSPDEILGRRLADRLGDHADALEVEDGLRKVHAEVADRAAGPSRARFIVPVAAALALVAGVAGAITLSNDASEGRPSLETGAITDVTLKPADGDISDIVEFAILMEPDSPAGEVAAVEAFLEQLTPDGSIEELDADERRVYAGSISADDGQPFDLDDVGSIYRLQVPDDTDVEDLVIQIQTLPGVESVDSSPPVTVVECGAVLVSYEPAESTPDGDEEDEADDDDDHRARVDQDDGAHGRADLARLPIIVRGADVSVALTDDIVLHRGATSEDHPVRWTEADGDGDSPCASWSLTASELLPAELAEVVDDLEFSPARGFTITALLGPPDSTVLSERAIAVAATNPTIDGPDGELPVRGWHFTESLDGDLLGATLSLDGDRVCVLRDNSDEAGNTHQTSCITTLALAVTGTHTFTTHGEEGWRVIGLVVDQIIAVAADGNATEPRSGLYMLEWEPGLRIDHIVRDDPQEAAMAVVTAAGWDGVDDPAAGCAISDRGYRATVTDPDNERWIDIEPGSISSVDGDDAVVDDDADTIIRVEAGTTVIRAHWEDGEVEIVCNDNLIDTRGTPGLDR